MRIQHNIMAMNAYRNYTGNTRAVSKNLEKLSSGYRINRAGDDAAGLAISEKMRAQVTGLKAAQKNAKDGISLVQTAEGALTEVHSMLNRMVDLADQSANGTYANETDRENLQKEVDALKTEINRIADSTNFNGIKLLDGTMGGASTKLSPKITYNIANATNSAAASIAKSDPIAGKITAAAALGAGTAGAKGTYSIEYKDVDGTTKTMDIAYEQDGTATASATQHGKDVVDALNANSEFSSMFKAENNAGSIIITSKEAGTTVPQASKIGIKGTLGGTVAAAADAKTTMTGTLAAGDSITVDGRKYTMSAATDLEKGTFANDAGLIALLAKDGYTATGTLAAGMVIGADPKATGKGLTLQIGDTSESFNQLTVRVGDMHAKNLGIADVDISTQGGAQAAVKQLKDAINQVSGTRGDLGATQNRLEHTINNLSVMTENIQDAEANIRDVDVAEEMMSYTKNNILVQSAQAMLAQANQLPQGVLQLLQ